MAGTAATGAEGDGMDLRTQWLGRTFPHPFFSGASPRADRIDLVRRFEDAGAAAIVMHSLFEEQIADEPLAEHDALEAVNEASAEASSYFPEAQPFAVAPDAYVEQVGRIRAAVSVPVIAALDGTRAGTWLEYARLLEQAGAHALELNVHSTSVDLDEDAAAVEDRVVEMVRVVRGMVRIPLSVKIGPFFSSLAAVARRLHASGADGLVLFHRFHQPDIDVEELEAGAPQSFDLRSELLLRLRWLAVLAGKTDVPLAMSGGVETSLDAIKAMMTGARAVQLPSEWLAEDPTRLARFVEEVRRWLEEHEYASLAQLQGSMSLSRCPDPRAWARASYVHIIRSRRP